jgi:hypothetical protein
MRLIMYLGPLFAATRGIRMRLISSLGRSSNQKIIAAPGKDFIKINSGRRFQA